MGKHTHAKQSNNAGIAANANANANEKTSSGSKWARKFNVLDYHRWHYVKKVLAHKKHHEGRGDVTESDSRAIAYNNDHDSSNELIDNTQFEAQKTDPSNPKRSIPLPSSPQSKSSTMVALSPTKSSRATRIKKMIAKEVTKRTGRHRRSSTCPASSELGRTTLDDQHLEIPDEGLGFNESKSPKISSRQDHASDGHHKTCDLCSTRNIECNLDSKQAGEESEHQYDQVQLPNTPLNRLPFRGKIDRSASLHHSRDFLDTLDVLSMNKDFFVRVSIDNASPRKDQQLSRPSNRNNTLMKSGTFPINDPSFTNDSSFPSLLSNLRQQNSFTHENNSLQIRIENSGSSGRRFKDLRHKIKHLIKEDRKERRRIAMDAVLHKVPFGQKVSEETVNEIPCASICETDSLVSPNKGEKFCRRRRRRSASLDESLDKYCQLFETTSFRNREPNNKINEHQSSRLRVMDENSSRSHQKGLARILSSPNLDMFSSYHSVDCDGYISSKTPNRRIMSFSERKVVEDVSNIEMESRIQFDADKETCKDLEEFVDDSNAEVISSVNNDDEDAIIDQGDDTTKGLEVDFDDNNDGVVTTQSTDTVLQSLPHMGTYEHDRTLLEDPEVAESKDSESPTLSYTVIEEDTENSQIHYTSPKHHHIQVRSSEIAEFNYVKDILQLSGYSGNQLLGTWYSSEQPLDPSVFIELESSSLVEPQGDHTNHLLLFDLINEVLLDIYERSVSYWCMPLCSSSCSQKHPMPKGYYVLKEVWNCINWYIGCSRPELDPSLDYITTRDLAKYDGWMNLQFDAECVGLELEDLIFDDLLSEVIS